MKGQGTNIERERHAWQLHIPSYQITLEGDPPVFPQ